MAVSSLPVVQPANQNKRSSDGPWWAYTILIVGSVVTAFPFVWMFLTSFKTYQDVFLPGFLPPHPTLENTV